VSAAPELRDALASAARIGLRLRESLADLAPAMPLSPTAVEAMDRHLAVLTDAFLKRFESLVSQLQDQVWPRAAAFENEDPVPLSRRDVMELMDKLRILDSADAFRAVAMLRNRLPHAYIHNPVRIAERLNEAYAAAPTVLRALETAEAWAARRLSPPPASP
jgi:uncharacterized protein YutE (UPF0331/DUF86 family)